MIIKVMVFITKADAQPRSFKKAEDDLNNYFPITNYCGVLIELDTDKLDSNVKVLLNANYLIAPTRGGKPVVNVMKENQEDYIDPIENAVMAYQAMLMQCDVIISHNLQLHKESMNSEMLNLGLKPKTNFNCKTLCLMKYGTHIMKIPGRFEGQYKFPDIKQVVKYFTSEQLESYEEAFGVEVGEVFGVVNSTINILKNDAKVRGWLDGSRNSMF